MSCCKRCHGERIGCTDCSRQAERARCMAALCDHCAEGRAATEGAPGEWWHEAGALSVVCRASKLRSLEP